MVAELAAKRRDMEARRAELEQFAADFRKAREFFEKAVWRDAEAYEAVRQAYRRPVDERGAAMETALKGAALIPLQVVERAAVTTLLLITLQRAAPAAMRSDIQVGEALLAAAARGARANVEINLQGIQDAAYRAGLERRLAKLPG